MSRYFRILLFLVLALGLITVREGIAQTGRKAFVDGLKNATVVLKRDIYTIRFVSEGALGSRARERTEPAVVILSPKGVLYETVVSGYRLVDDQIERLVEQVESKASSRSALQRGLGRKDDKVGKTGNVELLTYKTGEEFLVKDVKFDDADVIIELSKPFAKGDVATGFRIRLDSNVSKAFSEQAQVQTLIDSVTSKK